MRLPGLLVLALLLAGPAVTQEHPPPAEAAHGEEAAHGPSIVWKWVNFAILVAGLGYLVRKHAPPFFRARTEGIQHGIAEASRQKQESDARVAEVERRLKNLDSEIASLRDGARQELAAESERVRQETARLVAKIEHQAEQDIAAATKQARQELKTYTAGLAVELAASRIRAGLTSASQASLVDSFIADLRGAE